MQEYFLKRIRSQSSSSQSGQIAIIVLLIMVVLLILGLSLARRTSEEILLSGQVEDTTRVFNAAETGVEDALSELNKAAPDLDKDDIAVGDAQYSYQITQTGDIAQNVPANQTATVYLKPSTDDNLEIHWAKGQRDNCVGRAALIVSIYYDNGNKVVHEAVKPSCTGYPVDRATGFSTTGVSELVTGDYPSRFTLALTNIEYPNKVFARIRPLYASTYIRVTGAGQQMYTIRSEGSELTADGRSEQRTIEVTRTKPAPPAIFDYALYSGGSLSKP